MRTADKPDRGLDRGISALLGNLADGFSKLVTQHLALARMELIEDVKVLGKNAGMIAAFVPFVLLGYALLMVALSALLAVNAGLGWAAGFGIVGGVHLVGGAIGIALAASKLKHRQVLDGSMEEIHKSAAVLSASTHSVTHAAVPVLERSNVR